MSGEHWVMIAKIEQQLYFADSLLGSNFPKQDYHKMIPATLQSLTSVFGFDTNYSPFQHFKFQEEEVTGVNDVNVHYSISKQMQLLLDVKRL